MYSPILKYSSEKSKMTKAELLFLIGREFANGGLLTSIVLTAIKFSHDIDWPWEWVLAPVVITFALWFITIIIYLLSKIKRKNR